MRYTPETLEEWQRAVDLAVVFALIGEADQLGFYSSAPAINMERVLAILQEGAALGIQPRVSLGQDLLRNLAIAHGSTGAPRSAN